MSFVVVLIGSSYGYPPGYRCHAIHPPGFSRHDGKTGVGPRARARARHLGLADTGASGASVVSHTAPYPPTMSTTVAKPRARISEAAVAER